MGPGGRRARRGTRNGPPHLGIERGKGAGIFKLRCISLRIDRGSQCVFVCGCRYSMILMLVLLEYIHVI